MPQSLRLLPFLAVFAFLYGSLQGANIFVKPMGTGSENGLDWTNASNLQDALSSAVDGDDIWMMSGNHLPGPLRNDSFVITSTSNISLLGGFNGTETMVDERNWIDFPTIISGDIGTQGDDTDNSYRIFDVSGSENIRFDGLFVERAYPNGTNPDDRGGAFYFGTSTFTIENCVIRENVCPNASSIASAILTDSNPGTQSFVINSVFVDNSTGAHSGAISLDQPTVFENVVFANNQAATAGGSWDGGAITINSSANPTDFINCTFYNNSTDRDGGAITSTSATTLIVNSLFWDNAAPTNGDDVNGAATVTISNSAQSNPGSFFSTTNGGNLITFDGSFSNNLLLEGPDGKWFTPDDGLALTAGSNAIDFGDNGFNPGKDITGNDRNDGAVDLGAYEFGANLATTFELKDDPGFIPTASIERGSGNVVLQWEVHAGANTEHLDGFNIKVLGNANDLTQFDLSDITGGYTQLASGNSLTGNIVSGNIEFLLPPIAMIPGNVLMFELFADIEMSTSQDNIEFIIEPMGVYSANALTGNVITSGLINFTGAGGGGGGPDLAIDPTFSVPPNMPTNANVPGLAFFLDTENTGYNGNLIRLEYELQGADANIDFLHYTLFDGMTGSNIFIAGNASTGNIIGGNVVFDNIWLPMTSGQNALLGLFVETPGTFVSDNVEFVMKAENITVEYTSVTGAPIYSGISVLAGGNMGGGNFALLNHGPYIPPASLERGSGNIVLQWEVDAGAAPEELYGFNIEISGDVNDLIQFDIEDITNTPFQVISGNSFSGNTVAGNIDFQFPTPIAMGPGNTFAYELFVDIEPSTAMDNIEFIIEPMGIMAGNMLTGNSISSGLINFTGGGNGTPPQLVDDFGFTAPANLMASTGPTPVLIWYMDTETTGYNGTITDIQFDVSGADPGMELTGSLVYDLSAGNLVSNSPAFSANHITFSGLGWPLSSTGNSRLELKVTTTSSFTSTNIEFKLDPALITLADASMVSGANITSGVINLDNGAVMGPYLKNDMGFSPPGSIGTNLVTEDVFAFELDTINAGYSGTLDHVEIETFNADPNNEFVGFTLFDVTMGTNVALGANIIGGNIVFGPISVGLSGGSNTILALQVDTVSSFTSDNIEFKLYPDGLGFSDNAMAQGNFVSYGPVALTGGGNVGPELSLKPDNGFTPPTDITRGTIDNIVMEFEIQGGANVEVIDGFTFEVLSDINDLTRYELIDITGTPDLVYWGTPGTGNVMSGNIEFLGAPIVVMPGNTFYYELKVDLAGATSTDNVDIVLNTFDLALFGGNTVSGNDVDFGPIALIGGGNMSPLNVINLDPFNGESNFPVEGNLVMTFSENLDLGNGNLQVYQEGSLTHVVPFSPSSDVEPVLEFDLGSDLNHSSNVHVLMDPGLISGNWSGNVFAGFSSNTDWFFTTGPNNMAGGGSNYMIFNTGFTPPMNAMNGNLTTVMEFILEPATSEVLNEVNVYIPYGDGNDLAYAELYHVEGATALGNTMSFGASSFGFNSLSFGLSGGTNVTLQIAIDPVMAPSMGNIELKVTPADINIGASLNVGGGNISSGIVDLIGGGNMTGPDLLSDAIFNNPISIPDNTLEFGVFAFELDTTSIGYSGNIISLEFDVVNADPAVEFTGYSLYDVSLSSNIMGMGNVIAGNIVFQSLDIPLSGGANTTVELRVDSVPSFSSDNVEFKLEPHNVWLGDNAMVGGSPVAYGPIQLGNAMNPGPDLLPDNGFMNPTFLPSNGVDIPVLSCEIDTTTIGYSGNIVYLEFDVHQANPSVELTAMNLYDVTLASAVPGAGSVIAGNIVFNSIDIPLSGGSNTLLQLRVDTVASFTSDNIEFKLEPHNVGTGAMDALGGSPVAYGPITLGGTPPSGNVYLAASPNGISTNINPNETNRGVFNFRLDGVTEGVSGTLDDVEFRVIAGDATIGVDFNQYRLYENTDGLLGTSTTVVNGNIIFTGIGYAFGSGRNYDFDLTADAVGTFTNSTFQVEIHSSDINVDGGSTPVIGSSVSDPVVTLNPAPNVYPAFVESNPVLVTMDQDGNPTPFTLTLNANDPDMDTITWSVGSQGANGTATVSGTGTSQVINYTPDGGFSGSDSFSVSIFDGNGGNAGMTVNVTINPAPNSPPTFDESSPVLVTMDQDGSPTPFTLTLNASDADMDTIAWSIASQGVNGTASVSGTGSSQVINYTPDGGYNGSDSFVVDIDDGNGGNDVITVVVTINPTAGTSFVHSKISAGRSTAYVTAGSTLSRGRNDQGQLGRTGDTGIFDPVGSLFNPTSISAGEAHGLALMSNGNVFSWGDNTYGQSIGGPVQEETGLPSPAVFVEAGAFNSFVITDNNQLWAKGRNHMGQLGIGTQADSFTWAQVTLPAGNIEKVSAGVEHTGVMIDGKLYGFGSNGYGQLSQAGTGFHTNWVTVEATPVWVDFEAGGFHNIALDNSGGVWVGGKNHRGQLGLGFTSAIINPPQMASLPGNVDSVLGFSAGYNHSLVIIDDMGNTRILATGSNKFGQLSIAGSPQVMSFSDIDNVISSAVEISAGPYNTLIINSSDDLMGAGRIGDEIKQGLEILINLAP